MMVGYIVQIDLESPLADKYYWSMPPYRPKGGGASRPNSEMDS